jgi:uncharacterized membrane protein YbjE (DUF340 family)
MSDQLITAIVTVLTAIIGVAIIAVLISKQAATTSVINAGASGFSSILKTALSPVTGSSSSIGNILTGSLAPGGTSYYGPSTGTSLSPDDPYYGLGVA